MTDPAPQPAATPTAGPSADPAGDIPRAIVTGGSRGIGQAVALALAARGWGLTLVARNAGTLAASAEQVMAAGAADVELVAVDLADPSAAETVVTAHLGRHRAIDALVLAAGVGSAGPVAGYPVRRYDKQFALNTRAPFLLIEAALPSLRQAAAAHPERGARVIALASIGGVYAEPGLAVYGATKAALLALCRGLNVEESGNGVSATAIAPGYVDTDMTAWIRDEIPAERMIPVQDVAQVALSLLDLSARTVIDEVVMSRAGTSGYCA